MNTPNCPECGNPMAIMGKGGNENNGMIWYCDGPSWEPPRPGCYYTMSAMQVSTFTGEVF